jgi:RNA polymerase sigma-70 factor, ECF subfamily
LQRNPQLATADSLVAELYARSGAGRYGTSLEAFQGLLETVVAKYAPEAESGEREELLKTLHVEELVLARACAGGVELAWQDFLNRYRETLYDAARAIARDDATGRELADSLYADLYATTTADGVRRSKLDYYMGRGSLAGWLRTVLAQEFVNRYRKQKRFVSLEEQSDAGTQFAAPAIAPTAGPDPRLEAATSAALTVLSSEDRYLLSSYFLDGRKLAEIGRTLGIHESTVSRRLEKLTTGVRKRILAELRRAGMSGAEAEEALAADVRDLSVDVRQNLVQESPARAFLKKEQK